MSRRQRIPRGFYPGAQASSPRVVPLKPLPRSLAPVSPRHRMQALLERPDARALVRSSPVQDLFLLIKQVGLQDSIELLELTSNEQVQQMLDLDIWKDDELQSEAYADWLAALLEARTDHFSRMLDELDPEVMVWFLQQHVRAHLIEEDMLEQDKLALEALDGAYTPDNQFLLQFLTDGDSQELILRLIRRTYDIDRRSGLWLMESLRWELPSNLQERAYELRSGRIDALGFYDYYDALEIFAPLPGLHPQRFERVPAPGSGPFQDVPLPLEVRQPQGGSLLARALERALEQSPELDLTHPLLHLCNRVMAAQRLNPGELEDIREAMRMTHAHVNLGLELQSGGELEAASQLLTRIAPTWLFRRGHTRLLELRRRALNLDQHLAPGLRGLPGHHADSPWLELLAGLKELRPRYFSGFDRPSDSAYEWFETQEQVAAAEHTLDELEAIFEFVFEHLAPAPVDSLKLERSLRRMHLKLTPLGVLLTSVVRRISGHAFGPDPLNAEELSAALPLMFEPEGEEGELRAYRGAFLEQLEGAMTEWGGAVSSERRAAVARLVEVGLKQMRENYGALPHGTSIELSYLGGPLYLFEP